MTHRRRPWFWIALVVVFFATLSLSVSLAHQYHPLSLFDEGVHFDYIVKLLDTGHLPVVGSTMSPETLKEISCRGTTWLTSTRCNHPITNSEAPVGGVNYVLMYPPIYYGAVLAVAGPLSSVTGISLFIASRIASGIFFSLGATLITAAMIRLRVHPLVAVCVTLLVSATPTLLFQGSTVTPDGFALLAGGAAVFVATLRLSWRRRLAVATVVAILIGLTKPNFVPLATVTVLLSAVFPLQREENDRARWFDLGWRRIIVTLVLAVLPLVAALSWNTIRTSSLPAGVRADGGLNDMLVTNASLIKVIADGAHILTSPFTVGSYTGSVVMSSAAWIVQLLLIGGVIATALSGSLSARAGTRTMSFAALGALVLSIIYLPTTFYVLYHSVGTQARYAMPVVPLFAVTLAMAMDKGRVVRIVLVVFAVAYWATTLSTIVRI